MKILVAGFPGTGKTTYVKANLGKGIVFDFDALAGALRLRNAHEEKNMIAQLIANKMLDPFLKYIDKLPVPVFIIRTAPEQYELSKINPDKIVICTKQYVNRDFECNSEDLLRRLHSIELYAEKNQKDLIYNPDDKPLI